MHEVVLKVKTNSPCLSIKEVHKSVLRNLGFPENAMIPIVVKSIEAHLSITGYQDLLGV